MPQRDSFTPEPKMRVDEATLPKTVQGSLTLSIDVEDWHQLVTRRFRGSLPTCSHHVDEQTHSVLDLLDESGIRATFFVLGLVARERPELVRAIHDRGHEVGSHGMSHAPLFTLDRDALRRELEDSRKLLEDTCGDRILGFRAPEFSVRTGNLHALDAIALAGYAYDSSIFPIVHRRYGIPGFTRRPCKLHTPDGHALWELPLATFRVGRASLPIAGGGYFRLLPGAVLRSIVARNTARGEFAMLYFHPYEFSREALSLPVASLPDQHLPRMKAQAWLAMQALGRSRVRGRVRHVARGNRFVRACDVISSLDAQDDKERSLSRNNRVEKFG